MPNISILSGVLIGEILELNDMKSYTGSIPIETTINLNFIPRKI